MEQDVRHLAGLLAGKSDPEESGLWLPLWMHARDTAYVFCRLVQNWISQSIRDAIGLEDEVLTQVAYFLGLVHDIGKATSLFQKQILLQIPEAYERLNAVLPFPAEYRSGRETRHACASEVILLELGCPAGIASIAGAHHGKPQRENDVTVQLENYGSNYWGKGQKGQWKAIWKELYRQALAESGFDDAGQLPELTLPAQLLLTGLLTMADWIASNAGISRLCRWRGRDTNGSTRPAWNGHGRRCPCRICGMPLGRRWTRRGSGSALALPPTRSSGRCSKWRPRLLRRVS